MFSLMLALRGRENAFVLWFHSREKAAAGLDELHLSGRAVDDFGHDFTVFDGIAAAMITDQDRDHECQTELAMRQARVQAKANVKAQNDPALKFMSAQRGPGMLG